MDDLPMVTASTGAINSLLSKLRKSMQDGSSSSLKEARQDVALLVGELGMVLASLRMLANRNDPDMQVMEWMRQARDVAYDAEDDIDLYTQAHQPAVRDHRDPPPAAEKKTSSFKGRGSLFPWKLSKSKKLEIGERIREVTLRMKEANDRRKAYLVDPDAQQETTAASGAGNPSLPHSLPIDPRLLSAEGDLLVGLDGPRDDLSDLVDVHGEEQQLKVISIVGTGGIGKTTLAKEVSRAIHVPFHCRAFIRVGRNPSMKTILLSIFGQVAREQQDEDMEEQDIIKKLRGFLGDKRYLIVLDDIWSISAWKVIKCALPEGSSGSRIITTTRSNEVADACSSSHSCVHMMAPLSDSDSETLFLSVISSWKETDRPELEEIFSDIKRACGGVPLAVLTAAGLLTRKYSELLSWEKVKEYVTRSVKQFPAMQEMRRILHISYSDLTLPLRTCFLYLSSFPENHTIEKDRLIWRWIAEGFIPASETGAESTSMWSKGEICFNELINRRLIHPVFSTNDVEPVGCTVHGAVLDFILSMSRDENFVTAVAGLRSMPPGVVRRLSLSCSEEDESNNLALEPDDVNLSHVRALSVFGGSAWLTPLLENFQLLRVLDLQDAQNLDDRHLQCLGKFFHLRYLGLGGNGVNKLPDEVKNLQNLETLDVRQTSVEELPESITGLKRLARLLARDFLLQDAMEKMSELQELAMVRLADMNSLQRLANLMKLKRLRILGVIWCLDDSDNTNITRDNKEPVVPFQGTQGKSSVECLLLHVSSDKRRSLDEMVANWVPPSLLQKFVMTSSCGYFFPAIPPNMKDLDQLVNLTIAIAQLGDKDLQLLISLPALAILKLSTRSSTPNKTITSQGFPKLKVFSFRCQDGLLGFVFGQGSMPKLQDIQLCFKAGEEKNLQGINHLSTLRQFQATVKCDGVEDSAFKTAEEAIKKLVEAHPNKPSVEVIKDLKDGENVNQNQQERHSSKRTK